MSYAIIARLAKPWASMYATKPEASTNWKMESI